MKDIPHTRKITMTEQPVQNNNNNFIEHWLVIPKLLYFVLSIFFFSYQALLGKIFTEEFEFPFYLYAFASSIVAFNFVGSMLWTCLADRTGQYKAIIILTAVLYTACALFISYYKVNPENSLSKCYVFVAFALFNLFLSAAFPLVDAQVLLLLTSRPDTSKDQFGNQRLFSVIGYMMASLLSLNIYKYNPENQPRFQLVVTSIFIILVLVGIKDGKSAREQESSSSISDSPELPSSFNSSSKSPKHPAMILLTNPHFLSFLTFVVFAGIIRALGSVFQKLLGAISVEGDLTKVALLDAPRTLSEISVYLYSKELQRRFGLYWIIFLGQIFGILRILGYGIINLHSDYVFYLQILLELLEGLGSGLMASSAITLASRLAPIGTDNTAQGLYSGIYSGLAAAFTGIIAGGILKMYYKPGDSLETQIMHTKAMFLWVALGISFITILMMWKFVYKDRVMGVPGRPRKLTILEW